MNTFPLVMTMVTNKSMSKSIEILESCEEEFNGVPTKTCLGIHPVFDEDIDGVTGNLSLY